MAQTVIGIFDRSNEAQEAIRALEARGIGRERIDLSRGTTGGERRTAATTDADGRNTNAITDFFNSIFGNSNRHEAERYSRVAERSEQIVTVHAQSSEEAQAARDILDRCGAVDVDERATQYGLTGRGTSEPQRVSSERDVTIPRVEEELQVGKREVEGGGVRVRSRIIEKPVEERVRLREEHVSVEREAVNRPVNESDRDVFRERNIELTERSEVPVVNKEARVVEEVRIKKEVSEREETIRDTVRRTDVDVNRTDDTSRRNVNDTGLGGLDDTTRRNTLPGFGDDTSSRPL